MKFFRFSFLYFLVFIFLVSCLPDRRHEKAMLSAVPFSIASISPAFNKSNATLSIDSMENTLYIHLTIKDHVGVKFPVNQKYQDTLYKTAFNFDLYCDGKIITSDYPLLKNTLRWRTDSSIHAREMKFCMDTSDVRYQPDLSLKIPLYAFHELKKGKHAITLHVHQDVFCDEVYSKNDTADDYIHLLQPLSIFNVKVNFEVVVPPIYKSLVYGYGLDLKNDSTFSPAGMDNTIWKSSYPDIYWSIFYPENCEYCQTNYQTSTATYDGKDTFTLYHYYPSDSLGLGVYDHDNLSRDDGLGYWWGSMNELKREPLKRITFGNVKSFDVKVKDVGIIN